MDAVELYTVLGEAQSPCYNKLQPTFIATASYKMQALL